MGLSKRLNINSVSVSFVVSSHLRNNFRELLFVPFFFFYLAFYKKDDASLCVLGFFFLIRLIKIGG